MVYSLKTPTKQPRLLAESTLGRLAKWLRLAGFDTRYDPHCPDPTRLAQICRQEKRVLLTRTLGIVPSLPAADVILIPCNPPVEQARLVMHALGLKAKDMRPMTRCGTCNRLLEKVNKSLVANRVPEYVLQNQTTFNQCPQCRRLYWQGSHTSRWLTFMEQWFVP